ncbi:MAG TPA: NAD(P)/FAD-dependent oxidoreductase [Lacipirellulaceae bacterium]|nr:NAD(P)/FAD-dependent oxidoreductase [Lacipirellulaceae bacterium]
MNDHQQHWAVIGGGMLGMTLAHRLTQLGQRVTLCEAAPQLGGLASAWKLGDVVWDRHYHVTLLSDTRLRALLQEIGLEREMSWVETKTGFFSGGRLYSMSNAWEFLRFPPLNLWQRLRLGGTIFLASKLRNWRRLEKIPVEKWLRRWSGKGAFEKIWLPLLRAKLGDAYRDTSAAFIWAHTQRMYKARQSGQKKEMFGYVPGGYARILDRLAEVLRGEGVEIRCNAAVEEVEGAEHEPVRIQFADGRVDHFDRVVFTTPAPVIAHACPQLNADERRRFNGVDYLGIVCASLLLKKPLSPYYVTNITDSWVPLTAVIEMTTIVDPAELGGHSLVYLPKYMIAGSEGFAESDEVIRERCLATLEKMYPHFSRDDVLAFRISRARCVMALPTLGYSERLPPMQTSIPGVYAVNSAHILKGNLNVNETIQIAEEAMQTVLTPALCHARLASATRPNLPPKIIAPQTQPFTPQPHSDDEAHRELVARS